MLISHSPKAAAGMEPVQVVTDRNFTPRHVLQALHLCTAVLQEGSGAQLSDPNMSHPYPAITPLTL